MDATILIYVLFFIGLALIIKGGDWFVDGSSWIAEVLGVPKFIIGATIVSIATTLPEMIVSVQATLKGNVDMAAGNAIGSVTANTALIMGLLILFMPFAVKRRDFAPKAFMMLAAAAILVGGCIFTEKRQLTFEGETGDYYTLSTVGVLLLIITFLIFFAENYISMKREHRQIEPDPHSIGIQPEDDITPSKSTATKGDWAKNIAFFVLGAAGIIVGADLLVEYGTEIAINLNIPQRVISVVAIAIGTSLPELVTALTAIRKKLGALSVGNILGANIIDLTLILPVCSFVSMGKGTGALAVSSSSVTVDMLVCLAAVGIAVIPTVVSRKFRKWQGAVMLAGYAIYVSTVIF